MKQAAFTILGLAIAFSFGFSFRNGTTEYKRTANSPKGKKENTMKLGAFSISLSVKDLTISKEFYEKLGFTVFGGSMEQNYLIMKNEHSLIGLFQGMFEGTILTFNPGWDDNAKNIRDFDDVRAIQQELKSKGVKIDPEVDEKTTGPAGFMITDPDGNLVLIDQHR